MADATFSNGTGFPLFHRVERRAVWRRAVSPSLPPVMALTVDSDRELYFFCKRLIDILLSGLALLLLLPLMLLIAIAIAVDSPGPIFFVQDRVGVRRRSAGGRTHWEIRRFPFYKFRSMVADADQSLHVQHVRAFVQGRIDSSERTSAPFKLAHDPRVTRVGRILRRTSLDELPQLFNVLKGEMSLVGPRPVPPYEMAQYQEADAERLAAMPGITGMWQVYGRGDVSFPEMIRMDREYVRNQTVWLDLKIIFATIPAILSGRGAK
jgi:lipopolysaccharide/colanic/teichoic acid biosynthesis glycosyltransferase